MLVANIVSFSFCPLPERQDEADNVRVFQTSTVQTALLVDLHHPHPKHPTSDAETPHTILLPLLAFSPDLTTHLDLNAHDLLRLHVCLA
jgi:hypothetical protein